MRTSSVQVATAFMAVVRDGADVGGSLIHSPYAAVDAQTMLRLAYTYGSAFKEASHDGSPRFSDAVGG